MTLERILLLIVLAALVLSVAMHALAASGHFPPEFRRPEMKGPRGSTVLALSFAVALASLIGGFWIAFHWLRWEGIVIAAGLAVLAAPMVLQLFSDQFVDGWRALVTFALCGSVCALLLFIMTGVAG